MITSPMSMHKIRSIQVFGLEASQINCPFRELHRGPAAKTGFLRMLGWRLSAKTGPLRRALKAEWQEKSRQDGDNEDCPLLVVDGKDGTPTGGRH